MKGFDENWYKGYVAKFNSQGTKINKKKEVRHNDVEKKIKDLRTEMETSRENIMARLIQIELWIKDNQKK